MSISEVYELLKKIREKKCSPDELQRLDDWYEQHNEYAERISAIPPEKLEQLWININNQVKSSSKQVKRRMIQRRWLSFAALFMVTLTASLYFLSQNHTSRPEQLISQAVIQPGKRTAILKLSDGREMMLTDITSVEEKDGILIKNEQSKQLDYSQVSVSAKQKLINKIEIPFGGEYQLVLADGTKVWLNSGTELTYPVVFTGDTREVELVGEAYFEVTKTGKPFVVKTSDVNIRVLGTQFNISAYGNDSQTISTLVTGSVAFQDKHSGKEYLLKPGNSAFYNAMERGVQVKDTDTDLYTSWVKGEFRFMNMRLEEIFIKLGRWYNCSMVYEDANIKDLRFSGAAEKDKAISYVLKMIETVTNVKFKINGATITAYR